MRYTQTESSYNIYHCLCGKSQSAELFEYSTSGNPYGDIFMFFLPYNLGDKYCYCRNCKTYWIDGNAKEWNELSLIKKIFYSIGFWLLIGIIRPWWIFSIIHEQGPSNIFLRFLSYVVGIFIGIPLIILYDLVMLALMLIMNIPFIPFVIIFHWIEIKQSKDRIKHGSPNKMGYDRQNSNPDYWFDMLKRMF